MAFALAACGAAGTSATEPAPAESAAGAHASHASDHHKHGDGHGHDQGAAQGQRKFDEDATGVIDQPAPPWQVSQWFNSSPLALEELRGKVVFVRWFTDPSCPFCTATAPTLRALHERYAAKGLAVIGMYHHKSEAPLDPEQIQGWLKHYGYQFPIAIDKDWTTLRRWWLEGRNRPYTSVSFLLDKAGIVRRIHLGGTIAPEGNDISAITADVERLLAQQSLTR